MRRAFEYLRDIPPLALVVVAVGLVATAGAHVVTNLDLEDTVGENLIWEEEGRIPDSRAAPLGREGELQITGGSLAATRPNTSDFRVYRVVANLVIGTGAPGRRANASCTIKVPDGVIFARTPGGRAVFPQPSEDLIVQDVPDIAGVEFNAKGTDLVGLEVEDVIEQYATSGDVLLEWGPYKAGQQSFEWVLRGGNRTEPVELTFASMFRTNDASPAARISCGATTVDGAEARTATRGKLD